MFVLLAKINIELIESISKGEVVNQIHSLRHGHFVIIHPSIFHHGSPITTEGAVAHPSYNGMDGWCTENKLPVSTGPTQKDKNNQTNNNTHTHEQGELVGSLLRALFLWNVGR